MGKKKNNIENELACLSFGARTSSGTCPPNSPHLCCGYCIISNGWHENAICSASCLWLGFWLWRSNGETLLFWFNVEMKPCVCFCVTSWRCHPGINSFLTHCCFFPCFQDSCCCFLLVWETWAKTNVPLSQETKKKPGSVIVVCCWLWKIPYCDICF